MCKWFCYRKLRHRKQEVGNRKRVMFDLEMF